MKQRFYYTSGILLIIALSFITYYSSLSNGFIFNWDDGSYVLENKHIQELTLENIYWMFTAFYAANWHPLTWLSHAIDVAVFGKNAWGHHLTSVIFHTFNSVWVFWLSLILIYISEKPILSAFKFADIFNLKRFLIGIVTATLFAVHPQHVESVAWVAERKDVLFFFFFIPSLLSYIIYTQIREKHWYILSLICFILSLLSKPMAVTLPIILMLFDLYPLQQIDLKSINYRNWIINKIPFFLIAVMVGIFTIVAQTEAGAVASTQQVEISVRILNAFNSIVVYFEKWLVPLHLSPFYQLKQEQFQSLDLRNIANIAVVFGVTLITMYVWSKAYKAWLIGWFFYIITLLPVVGLLQVGSQGMADRYAYLTTLPFYLFAGIGLVSLLQYSKTISVILIIIIHLILIRLSIDQIKIWHHPFTLWDYAVRSDPDSSVAQGLLGTVHMQLGNYEQAAKHFEFSVGLADHPLSRYELGRAYLRLSRIEEALGEFHKALAMQRTTEVTADIYTDMAMVYVLKEDKLQAHAALEHALNLVPDHPRALALKKALQK